ncbi:hypothetical protein, partial [Streptomyces aureus]|uniref:hypothetical protein n=1 Tax=Streptomyces aureus TaxID=193461 RepID=UPI000AD8E697
WSRPVAVGGSDGGPVRLGPVPLGPEFAATPWRWVGALLGLFAAAPEGAGHAGTAVFSDFRVTAA